MALCGVAVAIGATAVARIILAQAIADPVIGVVAGTVPALRLGEPVERIVAEVLIAARVSQLHHADQLIQGVIVVRQIVHCTHLERFQATVQIKADMAAQQETGVLISPRVQQPVIGPKGS